MTQKSRAALLAQTGSDITTNNNNEITGAILRTLLIDIIDSALNLTTDGTGTPTLAQVLAQGAASGANDITMSDGRVVKLSSAGFTASLAQLTLTANRVISLPDATGTVALLSDLATLGVNFHHKRVLSVLGTAPGSPTTGDRYMVAVGASGVWATHDNKLAEYDGAAWVYTTPVRGDVVYSHAQTDAVYWYGVGTSTTSWQLISLKPAQFHHKVVTSVLATPPGSPTVGLRHLIASTGATGAWVGHENKLAEWDGSAWVITAPNRGDVVYSLAQTDALYWYGVGVDTTSWQLIPLKPTERHHKAVLSILTTPPGSPTLGDRHLIGTGGTGAWSGQDLKITEWDGTAWLFTTPGLGDQVYAIDGPNNILYYGTQAGTPTWDGTPIIYDLNAVINNGGNAPSQSIQVNRVREGTTVTVHNASGALTLDMSTPNHRIEATADITAFDWSNLVDGTWYYIELANLSGGDVIVTFTTNRWTYNRDGTAPAGTIGAGLTERYIGRRTGTGGSERLVLIVVSTDTMGL